MRTRLLLPFLSFATLGAPAQYNLTDSRRNSVYTYVYRLTPAQALSLFRTDMEHWEATIRTPVDSFPTEQAVPDRPTQETRLSLGDYLFVSAAGTRLHATLLTIGPLRYDLLSSGKEAALTLHTPDGTPITDALVYTRHHPVSFDTVSNSYRLGIWRHDLSVKVIRNDILYYFPVRSAPPYRPSYHRWDLSALTKTIFPHPASQSFYTGSFRSFFVFSKPKYRPGDTVRGKAFIMTRKGHPVNFPLRVRLSGYYNKDVDTIIDQVIPYRPGGYSFSFVLTDSLRLQLDESSRVTLEKDSRTLKRKILSQRDLDYEDYNLTSIRLSARVDKSVNSPGDPVSVFVKASDQNDLPVPDGRVRILVKHTVETSRFDSTALFIKDTLWNWTQPLDPVGETRIIIPDSIFPPASFSYEILCMLLNSDNEYQQENFSQQYRDDSARIFFQPQGDSLHIDYRVRNHSQPAHAILQGFTADDETIATQSLSLPATLRVSPYAHRYQAYVPLPGDSIKEDWESADTRPIVTLSSRRTADSVYFDVVNPQHLHFWYTITVGRSVLQRGYGDNLSYQAKTVTAAPYNVTLQYRWAGEIIKRDYPLPSRTNLLQVDVHEPGYVYPGERVTVEVGVKDAAGRPVPDADLTAWSYTSKFGVDRIPGGLPYIGKRYPANKPYAYSLPEHRAPEDNLPLDWQRWGRLLGLDTIEYYKFLNPETVYINRETVPGNRTQIAPFVSRKGQPEPVQLLYIDERPVYFSRTDQLAPYSFPVEPGSHSLRLRTATHELYLDSILVTEGRKTFVGINDDTSNKTVRIRNRPDTLTREEQDLLQHCLIQVENTFDNHYVLLSQGDDRHYLLEGSLTQYPPTGFLTGPFSARAAMLQVEDGLGQDFEPEGGNRFTISKGLIKEKEWLFPRVLRTPFDRAEPPDDQLRDRPLTKAIADSLWQEWLDARSATQDFFRNEKRGRDGNGRLQIGLPEPLSPGGRAALFVKKVFLFRYDEPDFLRIYKGEARDLDYVEPGQYRLFLLLKNERYLLLDSILVRPNGLNYYAVPTTSIHAADSFSHHIVQLLKEQEDHWTFTSSPELDKMRTTFNDRYLTPSTFRRPLMGRVMDEKGQPLAGVSVILKGTGHGTVTDAQGYFRLSTTDRGMLVIAYVGYDIREVPLIEAWSYEIRLMPSRQALNEVVVTGYTRSVKKEITGSVTTISGDMLTGKIAGVTIKDDNNVLQAQILAAQQPLPSGTVNTGNSLRHHFRDDAWWQPTLRTDERGMTSFTIPFPDDITGWKTFFVAVTPHRQIGLAEGNVRSYKALSAELSTPSFLVAGDTARIIGKVLNYMPDTTTVERSFSIDGQTKAIGEIRLRNACIDSFLLYPLTTDSIRLRYTLQRQDGYSDGEERLIPVYPAGTKETQGSFSVLEGDTTLRLHFDTTRGPVTIYAAASMLPVLLDEIEHVWRYEYGCNEQLASKLKALLQKKKVYGLLQRSFKEDATIRQLIDKLMRARKGGLWGWWPEAVPSAWITLHVTESLLEADKQGYRTGLDKTVLTDYLVYGMEAASFRDRLLALRLLQELQAKVDYKKYIAGIEKDYDRSNGYETLRLMEIRQIAGLGIRLDTLLPKRSYTALGSCYWGKEEDGLFDNPIQQTLLMYRLLRQAGGQSDLLVKTRNYFLEQRESGHWRNTYESCLILETLLPDLERPEKPLTPPLLQLRRNSGQDTSQPITVTSFPFQLQWPRTAILEAGKQGTLPVYFTAYQQYWNGTPEKVNGTFAVHTWFESAGRPVTRLKAGEPVDMVVEVTATGNADYVLVEAPIPASCTYFNKSQSYDYQEIHREYFKNKLSIFCGYLEKGRHLFRVSLMPRFTGIYRLNPARAEMMYFPVLYGRTGIRSVPVE